MDFDFLWILARQPLFRLFGAVIVLLLVDRNLWMGLGAAAVWSVWVAWSVGGRVTQIKIGNDVRID